VEFHWLFQISFGRCHISFNVCNILRKTEISLCNLVINILIKTKSSNNITRESVDMFFHLNPLFLSAIEAIKSSTINETELVNILIMVSIQRQEAISTKINVFSLSVSSIVVQSTKSLGFMWFSTSFNWGNLELTDEVLITSDFKFSKATSWRSCHFLDKAFTSSSEQSWSDAWVVTSHWEPFTSTNFTFCQLANLGCDWINDPTTTVDSQRIDIVVLVDDLISKMICIYILTGSLLECHWWCFQQCNLVIDVVCTFILLYF